MLMSTKVESESIKRDFNGVFIPAELYLFKGLSFTEKLLIIEIKCLSNDKNRGCYATNSHFSDHFDLTNGRISQIINKMAAAGYLTVKLKRSGKQIVERNIFLTEKSAAFWVNLPPLENADTPLENYHTPFRKCGYPPLENAQGNNSVIITQVNNKRASAIIATHFQNAGIDSLSADWENIGYSKGLTKEFIHEEFERFSNYWTAQPNDRKARKSDWTATWRNWLGKSAEMANRTGGAKTGSSSDGGWLDAATQLRDFL